jgi:hypothetical protein
MARDVARDSDKKPVSCFMRFDLEVIGVGTAVVRSGAILK